MFASYKVGTSRGQDTYGYTLVTLTDENGKKFRTCGGGYDMLGTVAADLLCHHFQEELLKLKDRAASEVKDKKMNYRGGEACQRDKKLYGSTYYHEKNYFSIDGACGFSTVQGIAKEAGINMRSIYNGNKLTGVMFTKE